MPKIGFVLTGGFKRLSAHVGSLYRYKEEEDSIKIERPKIVVGSSAGSIPTATCFAPWHYKTIQFVGDIVRELTKYQIFRYHSHIRKSLFSNEPLRKLIESNMVKSGGFEAFWKTGEDGPEKIKLEIPSIDLITAREWIFTNYLPEHRNLPEPFRSEFLLRAVLASTSIPALFPTQVMGDMVLDDAALRINAPLHRAVAAGCDVIFVFLQTPFHEKVTPPETWIEELARALDITTNESTRKTVEGHQETNQCLEVTENIRKIIARKKDPVLDAEVEEEAKRFPFHGRKKTILIPVVADEKLPDIFVGKFKQEDMELGIEIGYRAMDKALINYKGTLSTRCPCKNCKNKTG